MTEKICPTNRSAAYETVTDITGRAVRMDAVKKNVDQVKGQVDVRSESCEH
ncbi:MAG: hypothetical protein P4L55_23705 [Syntrophobacteraceae bacterium]|nr:hypothetical protein [Syntrophobacteraceae bacterium]